MRQVYLRCTGKNVKKSRDVKVPKSLRKFLNFQNLKSSSESPWPIHLVLWIAIFWHFGTLNILILWYPSRILKICSYISVRNHIKWLKKLVKEAFLTRWHLHFYLKCSEIGKFNFQSIFCLKSGISNKSIWWIIKM